MAAVNVCIVLPSGTQDRICVSTKQTVSEVKERICARPAFAECNACKGMRAHEFSLSTTGDERDALKIEFASLANAHGSIRTALRDGKEVVLHVHPHDKKRLQLTFKGGMPTARIPSESKIQIAAIHRRAPNLVVSQPVAKNPLEPVATPTSTGSAPWGAATPEPSKSAPSVATAALSQRPLGRPRSMHISAGPRVNRQTKPAAEQGALSPRDAMVSPRGAVMSPVREPEPELPPYFICLSGKDGALFRFQCKGSTTVESVRTAAISQLHNTLEALRQGASLGIQDGNGAFQRLDPTDTTTLLRAQPLVNAALQQNMIPTLSIGAVTVSKPRHRKSSSASPATSSAMNLANSRSLGSAAVLAAKGSAQKATPSSPSKSLVSSGPQQQKSLHDLLANVDPGKVRKFFIDSILSDSTGMRPSDIRTVNRDDELAVMRDRFTPVVGKVRCREEVELLYTKITELPWPTYLPTSFLVTVHAPNCVKKSITMQVHESDGVDEFLAQACHSLQLPPSGTMIKVTRYSEYLHEKMRLGMIEEVRWLLQKRKDVVFTVEPLSEVLAKHGEIPEPTDEYKVRMDGDLFETLLPELPSEPDSHVRKLEDLAYNFQVKILKTENVLLHFPEYNSMAFNASNDVSFHVGVQLFHGNTALTSPICTKPQRSCQFKEWVGSSQVTIKQACITVTARHMKDCIPIGWASLQLFDHKGRVRAGHYKLPLWPKATANPIGSPLLNLTDKNPMCLNIELPRFVDTPVLHLGYSHLLLVPPGAFAANADAAALQSLTPKLRSIAGSHPLKTLSYEDRSLLWDHRVALRPVPHALPKVLLSADWTNPACAAEAISLMASWSPLQPEQALQLLDSRFAVPEVRQYAVRRLQFMPDIVLEEYLLQLVQALKYEPYHDSALMRFLLQRSLQNRRRIGHALYWHLKSELMVPTIGERYGLMLQLYLEGCGAHVSDLVNGQELVDQLSRVAALIKAKKKNKTSTLRHELAGLSFSENIALPISSRMSVSGIVTAKCRYMDSFTRPIWVEFVTPDPKGATLPMIFKAGDDLRADILTLQMFRIMDRLWQAAGLDLRLSVYGCTSTGQDMGFIEVVPESATAAAIQKKAAKIAGPFMKTPLANWLKEQNPDAESYEQARSNFIHSCAGYCVATYLLGIGDRHNDNILITKTGNLFHIDFAHFLGNVQMWQGIKRERAPFVLTPEFVYVMGKEDGEHFQLFVHLCCTAYNVLRRHAHLFISLFAMMLSTGIPELTCAEDIDYLCQAFALGKTDEEAAQIFRGLIQESLKTMATQVNFFIHNMAHLQT